MDKYKEAGGPQVQVAADNAELHRKKSDVKVEPEGQKTLFATYVHIGLVVATYWVISIATVFMNKALLSSQEVNLDAPLFVTWYQCIISTLICYTMSCLSKIFPHHVTFPEGTPLDRATMWKILPLSILFTAMISLNNLCLKFVSVSFYYISRSLSTVFNVILTYLVLGQTTSRKAVLCCMMILFGFWLGVDQENLVGSLSVIGTVYGVLGSLLLSMYSIQTKYVLPVVRQEIWLLSYYNNFYSSFLFLPLILINNELTEIINYPKLFHGYFWLLMTLGGLCGFSIGYVTMLQIKVTSPLTHNISGTAKACAQTVIATFWFNETKSVLWWVSNYVVLFGSGSYARVKQQEMEEKHRSEQLSLSKA